MYFENETNIVNTCGICEKACKTNEIPDHDCLNGYNRYMVEETTQYFYPILDDDTIVKEINKVENKKEATSTPLLQDVSKSGLVSFLDTKLRKETKFTFDDIKILIQEVQKRPPLWNYSIPLAERSSVIKSRLWKEVSIALGKRFKVDNIKLKFKSLHDTYRKIVQSEHNANGARKESGRKWAYYESMAFLYDSCLFKNSTVLYVESDRNEKEICSIPSTSMNMNDDDLISIETDTPLRKKKRKNNDTTSGINKIANEICQPNRTTTLPPPPEPDDVDSFLISMGHHLKKLTTLKKIEVMQKFLKITYDALAESEKK